MPPFALNLEKTNTETSIAAVEPALNAFGSMLLTSKHYDDPGIHEWASKTRAAMSKEELARHNLVMIGFHYAIIPIKAGMTFESYIEDLELTPPSILRQRLLDAYAKVCLTEESQLERDKPVHWDDVLSSAKNYVDFLRFRFGEDLTDETMESHAYEYVVDPAALKQLVTGHIRWFWKNHLQSEWNRVRPMLEESARAFNQVDFSDMTRQEMIKYVTGKDFGEGKWGEDLENAKTLVFIPNAHFGPYIRGMMVDGVFYLYFGAHVPEGSDVQIPELDRAEIVSKLSALADETRLQILQMISENGEMRAPEVMDALQLSQPSVSRYLGQLVVNGFLQERRMNGAKIYALNHDRIEKTLKAVSAFLLDRS